VDPHLLLAIAEGCEPNLVPALLDPTVPPGEILSCPPDGLPPRVLRRLRDPGLEGAAQRWLDAAAAHGLLLLTPSDPRYPESLRSLALRPNAIFLRGDPAALHHDPALAIVGSRTPTPYGVDAAAAFATDVARAGACLWSGLARGIDALVHRASLQHRTPTVAVLAGGLDRIYPPEHQALAAAIAAAGGCVLSELPPGRSARRGHFPRRNRILAAAGAVLVIEAGQTSGALQTARFCAEQGRSVFAVPGPWTSERSHGCHLLLREGAQVALDPSELLRDLGVTAQVAGSTARALQLSGDATALLRCLRAGPRPSDLVQRESGLPRAQFLVARLWLEQHDAIRQMPGDLLAATPSGRSITAGEQTRATCNQEPPRSQGSSRSSTQLRVAVAPAGGSPQVSQPGLDETDSTSLTTSADEDLGDQHHRQHDGGGVAEPTTGAPHGIADRLTRRNVLLADNHHGNEEQHRDVDGESNQKAHETPR
jgi:DNA processing protein